MGPSAMSPNWFSSSVFPSRLFPSTWVCCERWASLPFTKPGQRRLYRLNPQELKPVHDWIQHFERFWTHHLDSIKEAAEQKAKQLAARDRAASNHQPHSKEQSHGH